MGIFDGLFDPQQYGGLLGDLQRWQQSPQQAQSAFNTTQSYPSEPGFGVGGYSDYGGMRTPIFGQAPQPELSSQARMQQPQQQSMQQQAPQPQRMPGFSDRMEAAREGAVTGNESLGAVGAMFGSLGGFLSGSSTPSVTERALIAKGIEPTLAKAATRSPRIMDAVIQQAFGTKTETDDIREFKFAQQNGFTGTFPEWQAAKRGETKPITVGHDQRLLKPTGEQIAGPANYAKIGDISDMRKEVSNLPEVKRFGEALPIFRSMVQSHGKDSAAADLDYVYGVAKIFDPDSVVREGEMKLVGSAQSLPEDIKGFIKRVAMGEGRLTPEARLRILEVANTRIGELKGSYDQRTGAYKGISERANIRSDDVLPQMQEMPQLPRAPQKAAGAQRVNSVADAMKLPKGTRFIDPNGVERVR
jgi:hypothetical protein